MALRVVIIILLLQSFHDSSMADVYQWTDANGVSHYSTTPPVSKKLTDITIIKEKRVDLSVKLKEYGEYKGVKTGTMGNLTPSIQSDQDVGVYKGLHNIKVTDRIEGKVGKKFGIRYSVHGPNKGTQLYLVAKVIHPEIINPETYEKKSVTTWQTFPRAGVIHYDGWGFEHPWEIIPGKWTIQLWHKKQKLFQKEFAITVSEQTTQDDLIEQNLPDFRSRYSAWSNPLAGMQMRIRGPKRIRADREQAFQLYIGVEIKNTGDTPTTITRDARLWANKKYSAKRIKCLKNAKKRPSVTLLPGESTQWLQEGLLNDTGSFYIFATLQENEKLRSPKLETSLQIAKEKNTGRIKTILQASMNKLPTARVNTDISKINYSELTINQQPVEIDGLIYTGFKFTVPYEGNMVWSFLENDALQNWYIIPAQGSMKGFSDFDSRRLTREVDRIGEEGCRILFQFLQGKSFSPDRKYELEPGKDYIIWFRVVDDIPVTLKFSLNILKNGSPDYRRYFPKIYKSSRSLCSLK